MELHFVRRCKSITGDDLFERRHAATLNETLCGKELGPMWYVESSTGLTKEDVTCPECKKILIDDNKL